MRHPRAAFTWSATLLLLLCEVACGGRSIGGSDPAGDGGSGPDVGLPNDLPDAAIVADAATCEHSPLQGVWNGSFSGEVTSPLTGILSVQGTITLEIFCSNVLLVIGEMTGSEQSGASFEAEIDGEYDSAQSQLHATFVGWVESVPITGTLEGLMWEGAVNHINGTWEGEAPAVDGTGSGRWDVVLF
jgi:hypothetical protein